MGRVQVGGYQFLVLRRLVIFLDFLDVRLDIALRVFALYIHGGADDTRRRRAGSGGSCLLPFCAFNAERYRALVPSDGRCMYRLSFVLDAWLGEFYLRTCPEFFPTYGSMTSLFGETVFVCDGTRHLDMVLFLRVRILL